MKTSNLLFFIGGLAVGSIGMYFGMKRRFEEIIENEVCDVQDYYESKIRDMETEPALTSAEVAEPDAVPSVKVKKVERVRVEAEVEPDYEEIVEKLNYNKFSTKTSSDIYKEEGKPYIISFDEWNDNTMYEKKEYAWFSEDEVLLDLETEVIVDDADKEVGMINLDNFGSSLGGNDDELYIRNEKYGCDYHVALEIGSYADSEFAESEDNG